MTSCFASGPVLCNIRVVLTLDPMQRESFISATQPILVFFDGECIFCNKWVDKVMKADAANHIKFGPKQGQTFQRVVKYHPEVANVDSIVVLAHDATGHEKALVRSRAVLAVVNGLTGYGVFRLVLKWTPTFLADIGYFIVSKLRFPLFGRLTSCRLPSPEERARFVD